MCGRFSITKAEERQLGIRFELEFFSDTRIVPRFNVAPSQEVPVVLSRDGARVLEFHSWGLIPSWAKDLKKTRPMINARAETVAEKPFFKSALASRRCLIPADGFYEWKQVASKKLPQFIHLKDRQLFAFAGLWDERKQPDGTVERTCTIITTAANDLVEPVHDRMPVILRPDYEALWIDPAVSDSSRLVALLQPYPPSEMALYQVSTRVNKVANDTADLVERV